MKLTSNARKCFVVAIIFMLLFQFSIMEHIARATPILDIDIAVDKQYYNVGETVKITGNVTLDGIIQNDTIAAIEVDFPNGNLFFIRTVETGNVSGKYWRVQILDLYTCDAQGNPQTLFNRGPNEYAYVNLTAKNMGVAPRRVKGALYVQCSDNTPLQAFYPFDIEYDGEQQISWILSIPLPDYAPTGQARVFASLFTGEPKNSGYPYCPEKTANFSIVTTTPIMPPQPKYFNITFALLVKDFPRGGYMVYATTSFDVQIAVDIKQFTVIGPVPIITYYPANPIVCQTVTLNGSASYDAGGTITNWSWDFGDGTTAKGAVVAHVYEFAAKYIVRLTVTDNDGGYNSTARPIDVLEAWPMFHHNSKREGTSTSLAPVTNVTKWIKTIGPINTDFWMYSSPAVTPAIVGNAVFIGSTNGTVYAFDATTGSVIWAKTPAPGFKFYSSPAFADGLVFIGSEDGHVYALNATNGNTKYSITTGGYVHSSVAAAGNRVYVGSQDMKVYAFYTNSTSLWTSNALDGAIYSSPAVANGKVFISTLNGTMYALNETTGAIIWRTNLAPNTPIYSSPAFAYDKVYIGSTNNNVYALNATSGSILWNTATNGEVYSSPAVVDGLVFIGSMDNNLYALDAMTGALIWNKTIGQIKWSSPLVAEGKVFLGTTDGKIHALREKNGEVWWNYQTNGAVDSSPSVLNDILYVGSKSGKLYAFYNQIHDVAVTSVVPSKTLVIQNETITISATLWNKGSLNEVVNLTTSYNSTVFDTRSVGLNRGVETTVQISFNTTGVPTGTCVIYVNATLTPPSTDENPSDNIRTCQIRIEIGKREITVTDATPSTLGIDPTRPIPIKDVHGQGYNATIYVTIKNQGNFTESNIQLKVYWSNSTHFNQTISSVTISQLQVDESVMLNFTWITSGLAYGNYTISAYAVPVYGEENVTNNLYIGAVVRVVVPGDVSSITRNVPDGLVDMRDIGAVCTKFGTTPLDPEWDPDKDINSDGMVDMRDIGIACKNYGKTEY